MTQTEQKEMDQLREQGRILRHQLEATEKELHAIKSGALEWQRIAEGAAILAAERDAAKACARDCYQAMQCYKQGLPVPQAILSRIDAATAVLV